MKSAFALLIAISFAISAASCSKGDDTGNACTEDSDCDTGICYRGISRGYCTSACEVEGDTEACPDNTACKPIQGSASDFRCLLICSEQSQCPEQTNCAGLSNSALKVCEPTP